MYLRLEYEDSVDVKFLAAKTTVAPTHGSTIPRLELLSALLSKLLTSVKDALQSEQSLADPVCFTDSKASLYWIQGIHQEWKQFVENRATTIRRLVPPEFWRHCPGRENPADVPSRGMSASALFESSIWLTGPDWLCDQSEEQQSSGLSESDVPEECQPEMRRKSLTCSLVAVGTTSSPVDMCEVISPERYSSSNCLFRVTALVLKFVARLQKQPHDSPSSELSANEINLARQSWLKGMQTRMTKNKDYTVWKRHLGLFQDEQAIWRCGGRMSNSFLTPSAKNPILMDREHHLTRLLILDAHRHVSHNGVRETLSEMCSIYWVMGGRL